MKEVLNADSTLISTVPLVEDPVQVRSRGILSPQCASNVHHMLLIDRFIESKRLISSLLLSPQNCFFHSLSRADTSTLRHSASLVWVGGHIALVGLSSQLCSGPGVVAGEDIVCPLLLLELRRLFVCNEHRGLWFLALSVIKLQGCILLRVSNDHSSLLKSILAHGANVGELHGRVELVLGALVALRAEVNVGKSALVRALFSQVHL